MNTQNKKNKSFILAMVLWGLVQVTCGLFILVSVMGYWGHKFKFVVAVSSSYIIAGKCTIAFSYFRGKALKIAVIVSSVLSIIFGTAEFIFLLVSHSQKHTKLVCNVETVICLGSIFNTLFLYSFCTSTPGFYHLEEETDCPPPPYHQVNLDSGNQESHEATSPPPSYTIDAETPPPPYDQVTCDSVNQDSPDAASPPPSYTIDDWALYQANINLAWQGEC